MSHDFPAYRGEMEYCCLGCGRHYPGDSLLYTCPECGDVLLLVYLIAHMIWFDSSKPKTATLQQLSQFDTVARQLLDGKKYFSIGRYYIGHYSEFAFLSSIIFSSLNPKYTGLFWYTQLLARL